MKFHGKKPDIFLELINQKNKIRGGSIDLPHQKKKYKQSSDIFEAYMCAFVKYKQTMADCCGYNIAHRLCLENKDARNLYQSIIKTQLTLHTSTQVPACISPNFIIHSR